MKKIIMINKYIAKYMLFSGPFILAVVIWGSIQTQQQVLNMQNSFVYFIWNILSWNFILWIILLIYLFFNLIFFRRYREMIILKFTRVKERDERETYIIGQASRATFYSTLAISLLLLFFTVVNIKITNLDSANSIDGKTKQLTVSASFKFVYSNSDKKINNNTILSIHNPLSRDGLLILIILWQVVSFYYFTRKKRQLDKI